MIGIFGGTFDPVHRGHLALAETASEKIGLQQVIFIPLGVPPHRSQPQASAELRVSMLHKALEPYASFELNTLEVEKTSPSWTVETLEHFSRSMPTETLCLLLGSDAFKPINTWYQWQTLIEYCHIAVVSRKGDQLALEDEVADFLAENRVDAIVDKPAQSRGSLLWIEADLPEISSTQVRQRAVSGQSLNKYVPRSVAAVIKQNGIYGYE